MKVALTGGAGFVGSAIARQLRTDCIDHVVHAGPPGAGPPTDGTAAEYFDICDVEQLRSLVTGCDAVVHVAGPPSVADSLERPGEFVRAHVLGTASVLEAMRATDVRSIVYISSAEVYGVAEHQPVKEEAPLAPRSPYGACKAAAELLLRAAASAYGIGGYIVRPFSVYGAHMSDASLLKTVLAQAQNGDEIAVRDLSPVRDYCYVDDLAELVVRSLRKPRADFAVFNAAYGKGYSVQQVVDAVASALGRPLRSVERGAKRPHAMEIRSLIADISAAQRELGWRARHDLAEGIRAMRPSVPQ